MRPAQIDRLLAQDLVDRFVEVGASSCSWATGPGCADPRASCRPSRTTTTTCTCACDRGTDGPGDRPFDDLRHPVSVAPGRIQTWVFGARARAACRRGGARRRHHRTDHGAAAQARGRPRRRDRGRTGRQRRDRLHDGQGQRAPVDHLLDDHEQAWRRRGLVYAEASLAGVQQVAALAAEEDDRL